MNVVLIAAGLGVLLGFCLGVLTMWALECFDPDEPPARVVARLIGVHWPRH